MAHSNRVLNDVLLALDGIPERYYSVPVVTFSGDRLIVDQTQRRQYERRFMIEFATRYAPLLEDGRQSLYQSTDMDFEIPKRFMWYENPDIAIQNTWLRLNEIEDDKIDMLEYFETIPDFLVHASQDDLSSKSQKLIIEAKTNQKPSRKEIYKDIFHINIYAAKYNFQVCVLLLIHLQPEDWLRHFRDYRNAGYYLAPLPAFGKIFAIVKPDFTTPATVIQISTVQC